MSRTFGAFVAGMALVAATAAHAASSSGAKDKPTPPSIAVQRASLKPLSGASEQIGGLRIIVTQVNYPGVPDRSACRFLVRAVNEGAERVGAYALMRTYDGEKEELNTWMVPTGDLAPGESAERLYSCKTAQYLSFDRQTMGGWPGRCTVNGEERTPCPLTLSVEANLNLLAKD